MKSRFIRATSVSMKLSYFNSSGNNIKQINSFMRETRKCQEKSFFCIYYLDSNSNYTKMQLK